MLLFVTLYLAKLVIVVVILRLMCWLAVGRNITGSDELFEYGRSTVLQCYKSKHILICDCRDHVTNRL